MHSSIFRFLTIPDAIFAAVLAVVCALNFSTGMPAPLGSFGHDNLLLLDNAFRVTQGQIPHRDFSSAWGPLIFLVDALGLELSGMQPEGLAYAHTLSGMLVATWTYLLARALWSAGLATLIGILALLLIAAPHPMGTDPRDFGYGMIYNRIGYALFGPILVECIAYALIGDPRYRSVLAISTGVALALLAFLKISYGLVALPLVAASVPFIRERWSTRLAMIGLGCVLGALPILTYLGFDFSDMIGDLDMAAVSRRLSLQPGILVNPVLVLQNLPLALLFAWLFISRPGSFALRRTRLLSFASVLLIVAIGVLLVLSNQQASSVPLNAFAATLLIGLACKVPQNTADAVKPRLAVWLLLAICVAPIIGPDGLSILFAAKERQWPSLPRVEAQLDSVRGRAMVFGPLPGPRQSASDGVELVDDLNDGMTLMRRDTPSDAGVLVIDEFNPFNYLLDRRPPRAGYAAASYDYIFSDAAHLSASRFFGDARWVLVPEYLPASPTRFDEAFDRDGILRNYGEALRAGFVQIDKTPHWVLWRRKSE